MIDDSKLREQQEVVAAIRPARRCIGCGKEPRLIIDSAHTPDWGICPSCIAQALELAKGQADKIANQLASTRRR